MRPRLGRWFGATEPQRIADRVHLIRGGLLRTMNVYLLEDSNGITVFDAGTADMTDALRAAGVRFGGINRVVLGHADLDHRGTAPGLGAPVYCHPAERAAAQAASPVRDYHDASKLAPARTGAVQADAPSLGWRRGGDRRHREEGDEIAGFNVIDLPGHAPGLIGLYRESDRLALVSDCFYTLDPQTAIKGPARVPHAAFNHDTEQARASIRKLAALEPAAAWAGHANPVTVDVRRTLERAARHTNRRSWTERERQR